MELMPLACETQCQAWPDAAFRASAASAHRFRAMSIAFQVDFYTFLFEIEARRPGSRAASFTGWQGLAKSSGAPDELGQAWGMLGQPIMGAVRKNRPGAGLLGP